MSIRIVGPLRPATVIGLVLAACLLGVAGLGPIVVGGDPTSIDIRAAFAFPSSAHLLGTDELGRDTFTRLVHGSRQSLIIAVAATTLATTAGVVIGSTAGFLGGWVDVFVMRVVDVFHAIPSLLVAIGIVAMFGRTAPSIILALGIGYAPLFIRLVRGSVVDVRSRPYVDAARVLGASGLRLLVNEILPGVRPIVIMQATYILGHALVDEASLGFLGIGIQPPDASWGSMINSGRRLIFDAPWLTLIPGIAVVVAVFAFNLLGDSLRDVADPRTSQRMPGAK